MNTLINIMLRPSSLFLLGVAGFVFFFAIDRFSKSK
jgi:nitrogen fixation-related uncharacterized protein